MKQVANVEPAMPEELDLSSASGLIQDSMMNTTPCQECGAAMIEGAVLCTACGFNTHTGKQTQGISAKDKKAVAKKTAAKPEKAKAQHEDDGRPTTGQRIWKLTKVVIVLGILAGLGALGWGIRGALHHNPHAEAKLVKDKIYPGMTIAEVVKAVEMPPREVWIEEEDPNPNTFKPPKRVRLQYSETFMKDTPKERLQNGFEFWWKYSERDQLCVLFSEEGKVMSTVIVDPMAALGM